MHCYTFLRQEGPAVCTVSRVPEQNNENHLSQVEETGHSRKQKHLHVLDERGKDEKDGAGGKSEKKAQSSGRWG